MMLDALIAWPGWPWLYGISGVVTIFLLLFAGSVAPLKCALLLMLDWALSNLVIAFLGWDRAPAMLAPIDAVVGIGILGVAIKHQCPIGRQIFALFVIGGFVWAAAFLGEREASRATYMTLNVLWAACVLIAGGPGRDYAAHRWSEWFSVRSRPTPAGG